MDSANRNCQVVVVGSLNVDLVWQVAMLPRPGQTVLAERAEWQFGGKGANQAVAAARQGANVALFGALGADTHGDAYREHLAREGVNTETVREVPGLPTGTAHVYVDSRGENLIVVDSGANARLDVSEIALRLTAGTVLLVQLECPRPTTLDALRAAKAAGVRAVFNASPADPEFPWGQVAVEAVIVNEHECAACFVLSAAKVQALSRAARGTFLEERKIGHLIITQGPRPTLHLSVDGVEAVPTYPVQPRDTVGAGDTFAGALVAELARGRGWSEALVYANTAAALSTLAIGAQAAMPRRAEVEAVIRSRLEVR